MKKIVITGGDASGKSTVWDHLRQKFAGIVQEIPEIATAMTGGMGGQKVLPSLGGDIDVTPGVLAIFQEVFRPTQLASERLWDLVARANGKKACVLDRGMADLVAYDSKGWTGVTAAFGMSKEEILGRYDVVINLRSLALRDPELYKRVLRDNPSRAQRTVQEAVELDEKIHQAWADHPNLIVLNDTIEKVIEAVEQIILEETSWEVERKFYLGNKLPLAVRRDSKFAIEQRQGYLLTSPGELRVRHEKIGDKERFLLAVKSDGTSVRMESEHSLQQWEFSQLWPATEDIRVIKTRYVLQDESHIYEVDLYKEPELGVIVEIEFDNEEASKSFVPPDWMEGAVEVTENKGFKAKSVARNGGFPKSA